MSRTGTSVPVVLVTGAARRIGAVIAETFHRNGFSVIIHTNKSYKAATEQAERMNRERPQSATVIQADFNDLTQITTLAQKTTAAYGNLNVLVNNASGFFPTPFGSVTDSQWTQLMDSNLKAAFFLSQALHEALRECNGSIVNISDIYAWRPLKNYPAYSIAKAGLQAMTRSLALELAPEVRVNCLAPGAILWPEDEKEHDCNPEKGDILSSIPLGRTGDPRDIAEATYFLAREATYINGEVIRVDGGRGLNL